MHRTSLLSLILATFLFCPTETHATTSGTFMPQAVGQESPWEQLARIIADPRNANEETEANVAALVASLAANPDFAEMDKRFPGLLLALADAARPALHEESERVTAMYQKEISAFYSSNLNETEAREIIAFLTSPAMQRFLQISANVRNSRMSKQDLLNWQGLSIEGVLNEFGHIGRQASVDVSSADMKMIRAFYTTPVGVKFMRLGDGKIKIDQKWVNYVSPEMSADVGKVILSGMVAHIAKSDPGLAKKMAKAMPTWSK